jgi:hypothetical protein
MSLYRVMAYYNCYEPLGRPSRRWMDNVKIDVGEIA